MRRSAISGHRTAPRRTASVTPPADQAMADDIDAGERGGHLLLVTCADPGRLDLVLPAAGRHLFRRLPAVIIQPVTTRSLPAGGGLVMTASGFEELDRLGALALTWRHGRHGQRSAGYPVSLTARLSLGETVIAGAPQDVEDDARLAWPDISIVRLHAGTEPLRHRLTPHASFRRSAGGGEAAAPRLDRRGYDVLVEDCHDLGQAVRRLSDALHQRFGLVAAKRGCEARADDAKTRASKRDVHGAVATVRPMAGALRLRGGPSGGEPAGPVPTTA